LIAANTKANNCTPDLSRADSPDLTSNRAPPTVWTEKPLAGERRKSRNTLFGARVFRQRGQVRLHVVNSRELLNVLDAKCCRREEDEPEAKAAYRSCMTLKEEKTARFVLGYTCLPAGDVPSTSTTLSRTSVTFHSHYCNRHIISVLSRGIIDRRRQFSAERQAIL